MFGEARHRQSQRHTHRWYNVGTARIVQGSPCQGPDADNNRGRCTGQDSGSRGDGTWDWSVSGVSGVLVLVCVRRAVLLQLRLRNVYAGVMRAACSCPCPCLCRALLCFSAKKKDFSCVPVVSRILLPPVYACCAAVSLCTASPTLPCPLTCLCDLQAHIIAVSPPVSCDSCRGVDHYKQAWRFRPEISPFQNSARPLPSSRRANLPRPPRSCPASNQTFAPREQPAISDQQPAAKQHSQR